MILVESRYTGKLNRIHSNGEKVYMIMRLSIYSNSSITYSDDQFFPLYEYKIVRIKSLTHFKRFLIDFDIIEFSLYADPYNPKEFIEILKNKARNDKIKNILK